MQQVQHRSSSSVLSSPAYVGRFAPSPSGPLHFGSLVCALASYLHARQARGKWLVRIEDNDTPRVEKDMIPFILESLLAHGMQWDETPIFQSQRSELYQTILNGLGDHHAIYGCACSRKEIKLRAPHYDGYCRERKLPLQGLAQRWKNLNQRTYFNDLHYGCLNIDSAVVKEDPVLKRADGIYTYHFAVVVDDISQGITHVVRGADLIETTPLHISLFESLNAPAPDYLHIPLVVSRPGHKFSKQQLAPALDNHKALGNLKSALQFLGLPNSDFINIQTIEELINMAITRWKTNMIPQQTEVQVSHTNGVYCVEH